MQAEITFSENTVGTKVVDVPKIFRPMEPIQGFRQFIGKDGWYKRFPEYEKCISRFSWMIIIAAAIYLAPICINIFIR
ncbi:MAG: hypothetical protein ABFD66_14120 [Smithella sp.]|nr:hypothetical protein [Syntrophaceae bacterium]